MAKKKRPPTRQRGATPHRGDVARRIWLAGIGAYGRAFSDAQESLARMNEETSRVFEDLVAKGEEIEETVEEKGRELAKSVQAPTFSIDDRIKKMRARLGLSDTADAFADEEGSGIESRLTSIENKLDAILARLEANNTGPTQETKGAKAKSRTRRVSAKKSAS